MAFRLKLSFIVMLAVAAFFLVGCIPRTVVPLRTIEYDLAPGSGKLVVFLPGRGERIALIEKRGLFDEIKRRGYDVIVADLHLGYYINGTFLKRLREDVILPARLRGYRSIWLVGNSLGGNGSLFYIRENPGEVDGVVLLGPYLGEEELAEEILSSGGVAAWEPGSPDPKDYNRHLWAWIKELPQGSPPVFLCYGTGDRFAMSQKLLGSVLPPERVVAVDGGHDWKSWKKAWDILFSMAQDSLHPPLP